MKVIKIDGKKYVEFADKTDESCDECAFFQDKCMVLSNPDIDCGHLSHWEEV